LKEKIIAIGEATVLVVTVVIETPCSHAAMAGDAAHDATGRVELA
jgi:hypothetical protein